MNKLPKDEIIAWMKESSFTVFLKANVKYAILVSIPITALLTALAFCIVKCLKRSKNEKVQKVLLKVEKALFFSMVLRTLLAVYITLCVMSFTGF